MRRFSVVALAALLVAAPAASATIGSNLAAEANRSLCVYYPPGVVMPGVTIGCNALNTKLGAADAPALTTEGVVTRLRVKVYPFGVSALAVAPRVVDGENHVLRSGELKSIPVSAGVHEVATNFPVHAGERLALHLQFTAGPTAAVDYVGVQWANDDAPGSAVLTQTAPLGTAGVFDGLASTTNDTEALFNFEIERQPTLKLTATSKQDLVKQGGVVVKGTANQTGTLSLITTLRIAGELGSLTLGPVSAAAQEDRAVSVKQKFSRRVKSALRRAVKRRKSVTAKIQLGFTTPGGQIVPLQQRTIRAKLPKKQKR